MRKRIWFIIALGALALLWAQAEYQGWTLRSEIGRVYFREVRIQAVDAGSKVPLNIVLQGPTVRAEQRWPKNFSFSSTDDLTKMDVRWIGKGPIEIGVSAPGYPEQRIRLDAEGESQLIVPLTPSQAAGQTPASSPM